MHFCLPAFPYVFSKKAFLAVQYFAKVVDKWRFKNS